MASRAYRVVAHILLHTPIPSDDGETMVAYYRLYLASASSVDAAIEAIALDAAVDGSLDRSDLLVAPIDVDALDPLLRSYYPGIDAKGIWYRSGKGYHPNEG